jgi:hypothetical protein
MIDSENRFVSSLYGIVETLKNHDQFESGRGRFGGNTRRQEYRH